MLNPWFSFREDMSVENLSIDDLFLFDTILSEHNRIWITCKMFDELTGNIHKKCRIKLISKNNKEHPDRFSLFEVIDPMYFGNWEEWAVDTNPVFERVKNDIESFLESKNPYLLDIIKKKWKFKEKLWGLNFLIERYAFETWEHTEEVGIISKMLAKEINERYNRDIDLDNFTEFWHFHDLGKILIPAEILLKPGKLSPEEFNEIKKHSIYGSILIKLMLLHSDDKSEPATRAYANSIIKIALYHHKTLEAWYPHELSSDNLSLESEIVRISDIFHALITKRVYKTKFDTAHVWEIIGNMEWTFRYPEVFTVFSEIKEMLANVLRDREKTIKMFEEFGNEIMDSDHNLIENQLLKVLDSDDDQIMEEYMILIDIIKMHFVKEEQMMIDSKFPDYQEHKKEHDELIIRASFITSYKTEEISTDFIKKFIDVWLRKTFYIHSEAIDSKLSKFLEDRENGKYK